MPSFQLPLLPLPLLLLPPRLPLDAFPRWMLLPEEWSEELEFVESSALKSLPMETSWLGRRLWGGATIPAATVLSATVDLAAAVWLGGPGRAPSLPVDSALSVSFRGEGDEQE